MSRRVDITEKLSFTDKIPALVIRGRELEVNTDAQRWLVTGIMSNDDPGENRLFGAYELSFLRRQDVIEKELKLSFRSYYSTGRPLIWFWEKTASRQQLPYL